MPREIRVVARSSAASHSRMMTLVNTTDRHTKLAQSPKDTFTMSSICIKCHLALAKYTTPIYEQSSATYTNKPAHPSTSHARHVTSHYTHS